MKRHAPPTIHEMQLSPRVDDLLLRPQDVRRIRPPPRGIHGRMLQKDERVRNLTPSPLLRQGVHSLVRIRICNETGRLYEP